MRSPVTSTPNVSCEAVETRPEYSSDISIIEPSPSPPIVISDDSLAQMEKSFLKACECLQKTPKSRCSIQIQQPEKSEKQLNVEDLFVTGTSSGMAEEHGLKGECNSGFDLGSTTQELSAKSQEITRNATCSKVCEESIADSRSGSCDSARAQYYHNKLLATMQILENKEETVRVQSESLSVAEARIGSLTTRISDLKREVERKDRELQCLQKSVEEREVTKTDVSITALMQEKEQRNVINTLQDNLTVIEDLYRECFYETAKQECLIEMLRKSYLDVRLMDKEKADQIDKLHAVIDNQRWSLERCQDIALEVEHLKMEISNFLNSSNNDSGMWERSDVSVTSGVGEELQDILQHLLRLRELLNADCVCGLEEENARLRQNNDTLQLQVGELRQRVTELEGSLLSRDDKELFYQEQIDAGEKELHSIKQQLALVEESRSHQNITCENLTAKLQNAESLLKEKASELAQTQQQCELHENTIKCLTEELEKTNLFIKEHCMARSEMSCVTSPGRSCRARLADSECRARSLEAELENLRISYRQQSVRVQQLCGAVQSAQCRGAALCRTARAALDAVSRWAHTHRHKRRELEHKIKEKDAVICSLQKRLEERQSTSIRMSASEMEPTCSKCVSGRREYSEFPASFASSAGERREQCAGTSGSERTSCSSAPVPPRRSRRKTSLCADKHCSCSCSGASSPAALQILRCDAPTRHRHAATREMSPDTEELLDRVEQLSEALADGQRRWNHRTNR